MCHFATRTFHCCKRDRTTHTFGDSRHAVAQVVVTMRQRDIGALPSKTVTACASGCLGSALDDARIAVSVMLPAPKSVLT